MNSRLFLHLFTIASMVEIFVKASGRDEMEMVVKPMLMPLLIAWFWSSASVKSALERWTVAALVFSWFGDIFLLFGDRAEHWFIAGLGSFLFGHLCYIQAFRQGPFLAAKTNFGEEAPVRGLRNILWTAIPVMVFAAMLLYTIWPGLGEMRLPVAVYATVIATMALFALNRWQKVPLNSFNLVSAGALLFLFSDATIAWNRFQQTFESAGTIIMLTYLLAQLLIAAGVLAQRSRMDDEVPVGMEAVA